MLLSNGSTRATYSRTANGKQVVPYAICITDTWIATGSGNQSFTGTDDAEPTNFFAGDLSGSGIDPGVTQSGMQIFVFHQDAGGRRLVSYCGYSRATIINPMASTYSLEFNADGEGRITSLKHTQTAYVYVSKVAYTSGNWNYRHTMSDTLTLG